jgi:hypothetical protein
MPDPSLLPPAGRRPPLQATRLPPPARQPSSAKDRRPGEPPPPVSADQPTRRVLGRGPQQSASRGTASSRRQQTQQSQASAAQQPTVAQPTDAPQQAGAQGLPQIFSMVHDAVSKLQDLGVQIGERMLRALDTIGTRV